MGAQLSQRGTPPEGLDLFLRRFAVSNEAKVWAAIMLLMLGIIGFGWLISELTSPETDTCEVVTIEQDSNGNVYKFCDG